MDVYLLRASSKVAHISLSFVYYAKTIKQNFKITRPFSIHMNLLSSYRNLPFELQPNTKYSFLRPAKLQKNCSSHQAKIAGNGHPPATPCGEFAN
jgi:hypothetical protein